MESRCILVQIDPRALMHLDSFATGFPYRFYRLLEKAVAEERG